MTRIKNWSIWQVRMIIPFVNILEVYNQKTKRI